MLIHVSHRSPGMLTHKSHRSPGMLTHKSRPTALARSAHASHGTPSVTFTAAAYEGAVGRRRSAQSTTRLSFVAAQSMKRSESKRETMASSAGVKADAGPPPGEQPGCSRETFFAPAAPPSIVAPRNPIHSCPFVVVGTDSVA